MVTHIMLQLILIALNAVFACAEIAVISMNDTKLNLMATEGNKRAKKLVKLTSQPSKFLATIQVAITLAGFFGAASAAENFGERLTAWLLSIGLKGVVPEATLQSISVVLITLLISYITLVFGELVPKRVAMRKKESIALGLASMLTVIAKVFAPLVWLLTASTNLMLRLFRIDPNQEEEEVTEEEIRMMVDAGTEKGTIDDDEKELIQNIFEFDDLSVEEICTHRTDVVLLWLDEDMSEWKKTIYENRHTLYPVCGESVDDVVGILNVKDYFRLEDKSRENVMKEAVRPPYFVPESIKADVLFANMKKNGKYFAVVLDEYGGVSGIITMNDLISQIVGDMVDEDDPQPEEDIIELPDGKWKIAGNTLIEDVTLKIGVKIPSEDGYDTFGGYIFSIYGSVPDDGSTFDVEDDNMTIKVTDVKDHRIESAIVTLKEKKEKTEDKEEEKTAFKK